MNALVFFVVVLVFSSVVLLSVSIPPLIRKEKNISKFSAEWDGYEDDKKKEVKVKKTKIKGNKYTVLVFTILGSITGFMVLYIVTGAITTSIFGLAVGFVVPRMLVKNYEKNQRRLMTLQLEQTAEIMSSVMRSGSGIVEALVRAAKEVGSPLRDELLATANEIRLGIPTASAFVNLSDRVGYDELNVLSMAINLQQEGMAVNLSHLLTQIQENIRYKISFQRDVNVITAENRMAGWIVAALPFAVLAIVRVMMPDMIAPLFNTKIGLTIFGVNVVIILIGVVWMLKVAEIEV